MNDVLIPESEIEFKAIRSSGPGGQNVNKVATAVQLRFDSQNSSLPPEIKAALLTLKDRRISATGIIVLTARRYRKREANLQDAMKRLHHIMEKALFKPAERKKTRPGRAAVEKRLDEKNQRSRIKQNRSKIKPPGEEA